MGTTVDRLLPKDDDGVSEALLELTRERTTLEDIFVRLTTRDTSRDEAGTPEPSGPAEPEPQQPAAPSSEEVVS